MKKWQYFCIFTAHESVNGQVGFYKKPPGFPTLQELSGGFSSKVEQKVEPPASVSQQRLLDVNNSDAQ